MGHVENCGQRGFARWCEVAKLMSLRDIYAIYSPPLRRLPLPGPPPDDVQVRGVDDAPFPPMENQRSIGSQGPEPESDVQSRERSPRVDSRRRGLTVATAVCVCLLRRSSWRSNCASDSNTFPVSGQCRVATPLCLEADGGSEIYCLSAKLRIVCCHLHHRFQACRTRLLQLVAHRCLDRL